MATIENLQLSIEANDRASSKVEALAKSLSALKNNLPTGDKLNKVASGIKALADSVNSIDGRTVSSVGSKVQRLGVALSYFRYIPNGTNLQKVGDGIKNISNSVRAIDSRTVDSVSNKLTRFGHAISIFPKSVSSLKGVADGITEVSAAANSLSEESVTRLERLGTALSGFRGLNARSVSSAMRRVEEHPAGAQDANVIERQAENGTSAYSRLHDILGGVRSRLISVARSAVSTGRALLRAAVSTAWRGLHATLRGVLNTISRMGAPLRNIMRSIGRIAFYRSIRALIKSIGQGLKEGIENLAMFSKLMNEMDTHKANRVMSLYVSNLLYFKNAVATAVIPILKSLEPVFDAIIRKSVELTNVIAQLFSFLSGSSTYTRAKYYYVDFAGSLDKASGSASKLNKQLAQFDELNNLTTSGGGSGNDLDYLKMFEDPVPIEDWIKNLTNGNWDNFGKRIADKIKESLDNIDWDKIKTSAGSFGRNLAGFLNGFFDAEMFAEAGNGIAQALNTAIQFALEFGNELDTEKIGKAISRGINSFFTNFDFYAFGNTLKTWAIKLKNGIKSAVDEIDWSTVFQGLGQFLSGAGVDDLIEQYHTFYRIPAEVNKLNTELADAKSHLIDLYGANFKEGALKETYSETTHSNPFVEAVSDYIRSLVIIGLQDGILAVLKYHVESIFIGFFWGLTTTFTELGNKFKTSIMGVIQNAFGLRDTSSSFQNIPDSVKKQLGLNAPDLINEKKIVENLKSIGEFIVEGILAGIKGFTAAKLAGNAVMKFFGTNVYDALCTVFEIGSPAKKMYPIGEYIVLGMLTGMTQVDFFAKMQEWFNTNVAPWFSSERWTELGNNAKTKLQNTLSYNALYNVGYTMGQGLYNAFVSQLDSLYNAFAQIKANIEGNPIKQTVTTVYSTIGGSFNQLAQTALDIAKTPVQNEISGKTKGGEKVKTEIQVPKKPAGMPDNVWASQFELWKKNHPTSDYIYKYAKGGFPNMGSLFVAGEVGAELVGNINGRTGVANTMQIEDAMYQAVYDATSRALSENDMSVTIEGDMDKVFRVMQNKSNDFYSRTGRPAF